MTEIDIPFSPAMARASVEGWKNATARDEQKGEPGDEFLIGDVRFRLLAVLHMTLLEITRVFFRCEGFATPLECSNALHYYYPGRSGSDRLWSHFYARCGS